jgi:hypothetical protein
VLRLSGSASRRRLGRESHPPHRRFHGVRPTCRTGAHTIARGRPASCLAKLRHTSRGRADVLTNGHARARAHCLRYLRTTVLPLPSASAIVARPSEIPSARDGFTGRRGSAARSAPPRSVRSEREARRPAAKTSGPPGTLASTLTGPGRSGARVLLVLPQTEWGVKTPERCQTLVVLQVSKRPLDGGAATVRGRPFGRALQGREHMSHGSG